MKINQRKFDIVIQGAGPVGCVSALLADSLGMSVLLIDSRDECSYRGNAHYLNGYSLEALVLCGLDIESLTRSATPESYAYAMSFGTKFSNILSRINLMDDDNVRGRYADAGLFSGALNVRVSVLHQLLIQQIKKTNITLEWHSTVTALSLPDHEITILRERFAESYTAQTRYCFACDGANSQLRSLCGITASKNHLQSFINVHFSSDMNQLNVEPSLLYWMLNPAYPACFVAHEVSGSQNCQIPIYRKDNAESWLSDDYIDSYLRFLFDNDRFDFQIHDVGLWQCDTFCLPSNTHQWVFFVGDSSHSVTPAGGYGLNMGIADAMNLVWKIALESGERKKCISTYNTERTPINARLMSQSIENYRSFKKLTKGAYLPSEWPSFIPKKLSTYIFGASKVSKWVSDIHHHSINVIKKSRLSSNQFLSRLNNIIADNLHHFDGMSYHLGWRLTDGWRINHIDHEETVSNNKSIYDLAAGKLFMINTLFLPKNELSIRELFSYNSWHLVVFIEDISNDVFTGIISPLNIIKRSDFTIKTCRSTSVVDYPDLLLIRPDRVIAFSGSMDEWRSFVNTLGVDNKN